MFCGTKMFIFRDLSSLAPAQPGAFYCFSFVHNGTFLLKILLFYHFKNKFILIQR